MMNYKRRRRKRRCAQICQGFKIDRKMHLELALQRQLQREKEELEEQHRTFGEVCYVDCVEDVLDLCQLEKKISQLMISNGSGDPTYVLLEFYSNSCGICKNISSWYKSTLCRERSSPNVLFLRHNVLNAYDERSDISRYFKIKYVPSFLLLKFKTQNQRPFNQFSRYEKNSIQFEFMYFNNVF